MAGPVKHPPRQVYLGGEYTLMSESDAFGSQRTASALITPGTCIEPHDVAGVTQMRPVADPTLLHEILVPIELMGGNKTVEDTYPIDSQVTYHIPQVGYKAWMVVQSGVGVVANQDVLMVAAGGKLIQAGVSNTATANRPRWRAEEPVDATAADTRCRVTLMSV